MTTDEKRRYNKEWCIAHPNYKREWRVTHKEQTRVYQQRRKAKFVEWWNDFKRSLRCSRCPETYWACLDFHHRDPSAKHDEIWRLKKSMSKAMLIAEIQKCDVLCANCHRKLHNPD